MQLNRNKKRKKNKMLFRKKSKHTFHAFPYTSHVK